MALQAAYTPPETKPTRRLYNTSPYLQNKLDLQDAQKVKQTELEQNDLAARTAQTQANTGITQQQTANIEPTIQNTFGGPGGYLTQGGYESHSLEGLRQAGDRESQQAQMGHQLATLAAQSKNAENQLRLAHQQRLSAANAGFGKAQELMSGFQDPTAGGSGGAGADDTAARAAAFGRAKDQAGLTGRASVDALNALLADSGLFGSGFEASGLADIVGQTAGGVNEFTRDQMIMDANRASEVADRNYAGNITKRAQNLVPLQTLMSLIGNLY